MMPWLKKKWVRTRFARKTVSVPMTDHNSRQPDGQRPSGRIGWDGALDACPHELHDCLLGAESRLRHVARHLAAQTGKGLRPSLLLGSRVRSDGQVAADAVPARGRAGAAAPGDPRPRRRHRRRPDASGAAECAKAGFGRKAAVLGVTTSSAVLAFP
jgi:hypothetical protein